MTERFKNISLEEDNSLYNHKRINLPYTVAILKPEICSSIEKTQEIINIIEDAEFDIRFQIQRDLTKQEAENLFYSHKSEDYFKKLISYNTSGEVMVFLLSHEKEDPVAKWKELLGDKSPENAVKETPDCLRAKYGQDIIKNGFYGSDTKICANKDRDIFKFPIPQRIPDFNFDKYKISMEMLMKFQFPPNIEHSNVNSRLDIFALYGPILNYHSVDKCFCIPCARIGKEYLVEHKERLVNKEKERMGLNTQDEKKNKMSFTSTASNRTKKADPYRISPIRLLNEDGVIALWEHFCEKCQNHLENFVHLVSGREQQHIVTDNEIAEMGYEVNKRDLLEVLLSEKGNGAKVMIEDLLIEEPKEFMYDKFHVEHLCKDQESDYFGRYNYQDMQLVIMEDRRVRLNAWAAKILNVPIEKIKKNKHINPAAKSKELKDPKNLNFTLERKLPLTMTTKKEDISFVPVDFQVSIVDKKKYNKNEEGLVINKLLHRHSHKILTCDNLMDTKSIKATTFLMKNYNEGRHGLWDNYISFKGKSQPSFIYNTDKYQTSKKYEENIKKQKGICNPKLLASIGNAQFSDSL